MQLPPPSPSRDLRRRIIGIVVFTILAVAAPAVAAVAQAEGAKAGKVLGFVDLMKFHTLVDPVISEDGSWTAYELRPDRGDGMVEARALDGNRKATIERGRSPALTQDGSWIAALVVPTLEELENAPEDDPEAAPKNGLALLSTQSDARIDVERVESFGFSADGQWIWIHHAKAPKEQDTDKDSRGCAPEEAEIEGSAGEEGLAETEGQVEAEDQGEPKSSEQASIEVPTEELDESDEDDDKKEERLGSTLRVRHLGSGNELEIPHVESALIAETSDFLAYSVAAPEGANGLYVLPLTDSPPTLENALQVASARNGRYTALAWSETTPDLAFVSAVDDADGEPGDGSIQLWHGRTREAREIVTTAAAPEGRHIPSVNTLTWSRDGRRLFFGFKARRATPSSDDESESEFDPYDVQTILADADLDVWHVDDPLIKSNEREEWETEKDRTYLAVFHLSDASLVPLAAPDVRTVEPTHSARGVWGTAETPYLRERTWEGFFADLYWISLETGERELLARRLGEATPQLSPSGRQVAWYEDGHWHLYDADTDTKRRLTAGLDVSFADEDHDYPSAAPGYGSAGFLEDGSAVLIYDKFDIWRFPVSPPEEPACLTEGLGRREKTQFRLWDLDPKLDSVPTKGPWLVEGYRDRTKNDSLWRLNPVTAEFKKIHEAEKRFELIQVAEAHPRLLFTQESYREFPNLWAADVGFENRRQISRANPQIKDFAWGRAELVEWRSSDGIPLQGVLIRPETLADGERCPVLTYYYRFFSQRLHEFNEPKVNHRPSFPIYASHGYCVFLPDVRFEVGRPGLSAVKALVPGLNKLVEMGVADPDALGLHGHSWSGYQTTFVVTQTHMFAAAVAGAPVSNMTSAYGGIRYGTGLARQFQYERTQSRLGASLWQGRDLYIENSPLFYADRIETPLLLQFGDADEAVPWTQGVELYLALRRLDKESIFLQYRGEPHHLQQYANKLDYSIKMKQYFDHYLKGAPAPAWMTEGVPFEGED